MLRKTFFWLHLTAGIVAGIVIAVMSFTGVALAYEKELVAWAERDARRVTPPAEIANSKSQISNFQSQIPLRDLLAAARKKEPEARPFSISVSADPAAAVAIAFGRDNVWYANPYTGELRKPASNRMHDFMHVMLVWHRYLGFEGETNRPVGKTINGVCNVAFLFLAVSGLYLWWPRNWSWLSFKAVAVFNWRLAGKARDFNWHNSIGLWSTPILIVLTLTAVPMSFRWGNNLVYRLTGTEPPPPLQGPQTMTGPSVTVPEPAPGAKPLGHDSLLEQVQTAHPGWTDITLRLGNARAQRRGSAQRETQPAPNASASPPSEISNFQSQISIPSSQPSPVATANPAADSGEQRPRSPQAVTFTVRTADQWPLFSTTTLALDPFTGAILKTETFADQNAGRRLRSWTRYLHTGEALGFIGKLLAALASLGALFLCWTGFALSWRRFFRRKAA